MFIYGLIKRLGTCQKKRRYDADKLPAKVLVITPAKRDVKRTTPSEKAKERIRKAITRCGFTCEFPLRFPLRFHWLPAALVLLEVDDYHFFFFFFLLFLEKLVFLAPHKNETNADQRAPKALCQSL